MVPVTWDEFLDLMDRLHPLKSTVEWSEQKAADWFRILGVFSKDVLAVAMMQVVLGEKQWPEVADLYQACRKVAGLKGYIDSKYKYDAEVTAREAQAAALRMGLLERH